MNARKINCEDRITFLKKYRINETEVKMKGKMLLALLFCFFFTLMIFSAEEKLIYPKTKKVDVVEEHFGIKVADPYRWLEDDNAEEVKAWVEEQNRLTFSYLEKIPYRQKIRQRLEELYNYERYGMPFRAGKYLLYFKNSGLQNQSVLYIREGDKEEVLIDPNTLSADSTITVSPAGLSKNKRYLALSFSEAGSDWSHIRVYDLEKRQMLQDEIRWLKFSGAAFFRDGFFYSRYDAPEKGKALTAQNQNQKVYYHKLGTSQDDDILVYADPQNPLRYYGASVSEDEKYIFLYISQGTSGTMVKFCALTQELQKINFKPLTDEFLTEFAVVDNCQDYFIAYTNWKAPNYKLVKIPVADPRKENWRDLVPEQKYVLRNVSSAGGKLFLFYLKDVATYVYQYDLQGKLEREIKLPALGSAGGFGGDRDDREVFFSFTSFTFPPTIFTYDIKTGKTKEFFKSNIRFNPQDYIVEQVFYSSKDGTKVPLFLVYKKGLRKDGNNVTYLYAYGGFSASMTPGFNPANIVLLENGAIYALANIRGGSEYGEKWHEDGMLLKKQNVFDDFIAAAEYLIKEKYTSPQKLAIAGASNGGLLVGACMTQRPELFKVAFPAVGVMDMLRYHKFTVGWGWIVEYGNPEEEQHFKNLFSYSPLHNIKEGVAYPATLVTTADHDDRVVPAHSFKFIATLQEKHSGDNPVLIRIETRAGHGAGKPLYKTLDEIADRFAFLFYNTGLEPFYK